MDEAKRQLVHTWPFKADHDLRAAQRLADGDDPLLDTAIYHCQQFAKKAVKGFLVYQDVRVCKTHDIVELSAEAAKLTPNYKALDDGAKRLSEYAVEFRYPGRQLEPTRAEFEQAYRDAAQFMSVTLSLIPAEAHPAK